MKKELTILGLVIVLASCLGAVNVQDNDVNSVQGANASENCLDSIRMEIRTVQKIWNDSLLFFFTDSQSSTNPIYMLDTTQVSVLFQPSPQYGRSRNYSIYRGIPLKTSWFHSDSGCSRKRVDTLKIIDTVIYYDTLRIAQTKSEVDRHMHSVAPRILVNSADLAAMAAPRGGYNQTVRLRVTHFYLDSAELTVLAIPSWATLDTVDLCKGWVDSLFQQQGAYGDITKGIDCSSEPNPSLILRLRPDTLDIGHEFEFALKVSNRFGLSDTLRLKSIPIIYKDFYL